MHGGIHRQRDAVAMSKGKAMMSIQVSKSVGKRVIYSRVFTVMSGAVNQQGSFSTAER